MIRPFNLRDFALVRRLSERGVSLSTEPALIDSIHPLRGALLSIVGGDFPTYVWKAKNGGDAGFIQLALERNSHHAHIHCLGTSLIEPEPDGQNESANLEINENAWLPLLDQAVAEIGRRGIHSLVAEVDENGGALGVLRRAGFAVYTRQDIWVVERDRAEGTIKLLSPRQDADEWEVQLLYANIVPRLVQLVEPLPPAGGEGWVLREDDELTAYVHCQKGSMATWLRLFIHPHAETRVDEIVDAAIHTVLKKDSGKIYCSVRRYQSWIQESLIRSGFELWGGQAVMVKHTVQHLQKPLPELKAALDGQGITVSAPMVQRYHQPHNGNIR